jgi:HTH-type transcriptional regulator/antitoxin MqsA
MEKFAPHYPLEALKAAVRKLGIDAFTATAIGNASMRTPAYCLQCDDGTLLEQGARAMAFAYRGKNLMAPAVRGWHCPVCGECEFDEGEGERYSEALDAFAAQVDEEEAAWLRSIRKKLGLKQAEAGKLFGGGASAFSEYERGKTQAHKSTILLLRLLEKHPELLKELLPSA